MKQPDSSKVYDEAQVYPEYIIIYRREFKDHSSWWRGGDRSCFFWAVKMQGTLLVGLLVTGTAQVHEQW